jgi:hypothetical protein
MPSSRFLISSQTLGSSAATITFSSIPTGYTDLVFRASAKTDYAAIADYFILRFNGDNTTTYSDTRLVAYGGTGTLSDRSSSNTSNYNISIDGTIAAAANTFSNTEIYIPSYNSTGTKPYSASSVVESNSATDNQILANAAQYRGASGITSIVVYPSGGTVFLTGSSFYLYGLKNS